MQDVIEDSFVVWEPYHKDDHLCDRFSVEQWKQIAGDIKSDTEWGEFVGRYVNSIQCWVLKNRATNHPIAFVYLFNEEGCWEKVSIHGGGWEKPLLYYRGYILMLQHLLGQGIKVRTYCSLSNIAAIRFDRSVGFIPYKYTDNEVFMWINTKRLKSSKLYKYFYH